MDRYSSLPRETIERRRRILGLGLLTLGAILVANSVLGPLLLDAIDYPVSTTMRNQTIGLDAANLAVVAPACAVIGWLALRGKLIFLMDLGLFVPAAIGVMVGLWRGSEWAVPALAGLVGWYLLVTVAVGAMSITMVLNDDRYASNGQVALFAALTLALLVYGLVVFRVIRSGIQPHSEWHRT